MSAVFPGHLVNFNVLCIFEPGRSDISRWLLSVGLPPSSQFCFPKEVLCFPLFEQVLPETCPQLTYPVTLHWQVWLPLVCGPTGNKCFMPTAELGVEQPQIIALSLRGDTKW